MTNSRLRRRVMAVLHVSASREIASCARKILRAKIIVARARCTRLQNMCNARTYLTNYHLSPTS